ncbi:MAG: nitrilase-related carbon-nitrogen hydrolase, partial [Alphaproteobacteria bacterium]
MKIALCQINVVVGALDYNLTKIKDFWMQSKADLTVFPELTVSGYPAQDFIENRFFLSECESALNDLLEFSKTVTSAALVGIPKLVGDRLYNAAVLIHKGVILSIVYKTMLPNYGVFDEKRNFCVGDNHNIVEFHGKKLGILV